MLYSEVNSMDNTNETQQSEQEKYVPRPAWQVKLARVGLVAFILFVIWQVLQIAMGGF